MLLIKQILYKISLASIEHNFGHNKNMIIHHGLLGSSKNFRSLSKHPLISKHINSHLIDCRNHGDSPHTLTHTISDLANDIYQYIIEHKLLSYGNIILMGHSMGALAMMQFTKLYSNIQNNIDKIILIDISAKPIKNNDTLNIGSMLKKILEISLKQQIEQIYKQIEHYALNKQISQLIKSNLILNNNNNNNNKQIKWKINLQTIVEYYQQINNYNLKNIKLQWNKPIELIYGCKSKYINSKQLQFYKQYYPQMTQKNFHPIQEAGHWVHYDQPIKFLEVMNNILSYQQQ